MIDDAKIQQPADLEFPDFVVNSVFHERLVGEVRNREAKKRAGPHGLLNHRG
jgi:hypothetical protein